MKKSGIVAASVAAASATAVSTASSSKIQFPREDDNCARKTGQNTGSQGSASSDKFAPRFDGLRFIETLVTAHR
ncbi:hypothetical protein ACS0TY_017689 [Phlomoides rotata]